MKSNGYLFCVVNEKSHLYRAFSGNSESAVLWRYFWDNLVTKMFSTFSASKLVNNSQGLDIHIFKILRRGPGGMQKP